METDINLIHNKIISKLQENNISNLQETKQKLISLCDKNNTVSLQNILKDNIDKINKQIENLNNNASYNFYLMESLGILSKYNAIINTPTRINFMNPIQIDTKQKDELIKQYLTIAQKYINLDHLKLDVNKHIVICNNCNGNDIYKNIEGDNICLHCGNTFQIMNTNETSYKDLQRANITSKYSYDRKLHFRDSINQFQGKQNSSIPDKLYDELREYLKYHNILVGFESTPKIIRYENVTTNIIHTFLKEYKYSKYYDDIHLIHYIITGKKPRDITKLEPDLLNDFDILLSLYDKIIRKDTNKTKNRKNFINTQYVLYQLLKKYNYPCDISEFNILKTSDRKSFHDNICKELFQKLNWNFTPIL